MRSCAVGAPVCPVPCAPPAPPPFSIISDCPLASGDTFSRPFLNFQSPGFRPPASASPQPRAAARPLSTTGGALGFRPLFSHGDRHTALPMWSGTCEGRLRIVGTPMRSLAVYVSLVGRPVVGGLIIGAGRERNRHRWGVLDVCSECFPFCKTAVVWLCLRERKVHTQLCARPTDSFVPVHSLQASMGGCGGILHPRHSGRPVAHLGDV